MVKRLLSLLTFCLMMTSAVFAQTGTLSGTVTDQQSGETLPSVNIFIVELQRGAATNAQGEFTIEDIDYGTYTVRATYVGYKTFEQQVTIDQSTETLDITLAPSTQQLEDVVVTAYGIEQSMNDLPYSAQQVDGDVISETRTQNFAAALNGRVAGLKITQSNGMGGSTNIVMRGYSSISGDNQALIVVDGVPYANQDFNTASVKEGFAGYDFGNTGVDINPDNIKSINVLKGPAAAALYGSRASNGAIVIQTKTGQKGNQPVQVTFNSSATFTRVNPNTWVDRQMQYGAGYYGKTGYNDVLPASYAGFYDSYNGVPIGNVQDDASYGPEFKGQMVYQWDAFVEGGPNYLTATPWEAADHPPIDFFNTGTQFNNSILINGGFSGGYYSMGYNQTNTTGMLPNSTMDKYKLNFSAGYDVSERLTVSGKIQYSNTSAKGRPQRGYSTTMSSFRQWYPANVDVMRQKEAYFRNRTNATWNWGHTSLGTDPIYWDNPYWTRYENYETDGRDRYFGNVQADFDITDWLYLTGRVSIDSYNQVIEDRTQVGSLNVSQYELRRQNFTELNYDVLANYKKQLNESFRISGVVGMNLRRDYTNGFSAQTNGGLVVPGLYSLNNSVSSIQYPSETERRLGVNGYFASLNINYNDYLTLEATGRRDKSSSLPEGQNVYYYPSVSASFNFSEFIDADWLSFAKVRANWAEVGNTAPAYSLNNYYDRPSNFGSTALYSNPATKNKPDLKPERTKSWELGLQMSFFNDRFSFDANYYKMNTINQILATAVSRATGYSYQYVNAGNIENKGLELTVTARPVVTRDFAWTIDANWNKNVNKVKELAPGINNYQLADPQGAVTISAALGEPYGAIRGTDFVNLDGEPWSENGGKRLMSGGFYETTSSSNNIIGNGQPDWTGGISNRLNYKNWSFNFLIDVSYGGDIFSLDQYYGQGTGIYANTAGNNDLGNPKRNTLANGGGVILPGYNADGSKNTTRIPAGSILGAYGYVYNPAAAFVYDASFVKLRSVGLTYNLPQNVISQLGPIKGASFSVIGRNLWIIHKNLPDSDPEQGIVSGNVQGYQGAAYPGTRDFTFNLKLEF